MSRLRSIVPLPAPCRPAYSPSGLAPVPIALGALAFERRAPGALVVAEVTVVSVNTEGAEAVLVGTKERLGAAVGGARRRARGQRRHSRRPRPAGRFPPRLGATPPGLLGPREGGARRDLERSPRQGRPRPGSDRARQPAPPPSRSPRAPARAAPLVHHLRHRRLHRRHAGAADPPHVERGRVPSARRHRGPKR